MEINSFSSANYKTDKLWLWPINISALTWKHPQELIISGKTVDFSN